MRTIANLLGTLRWMKRQIVYLFSPVYTSLSFSLKTWEMRSMQLLPIPNGTRGMSGEGSEDEQLPWSETLINKDVVDNEWSLVLQRTERRKKLKVIKRINNPWLVLLYQKVMSSSSHALGEINTARHGRKASSGGWNEGSIEKSGNKGRKSGVIKPGASFVLHKICLPVQEQWLSTTTRTYKTNKAKIRLKQTQDGEGYQLLHTRTLLFITFSSYSKVNKKICGFLRHSLGVETTQPPARPDHFQLQNEIGFTTWFWPKSVFIERFRLPTPLLPMQTLTLLAPSSTMYDEETAIFPDVRMPSSSPTSRFPTRRMNNEMQSNHKNFSRFRRSVVSGTGNSSWYVYRESLKGERETTISQVS